VLPGNEDEDLHADPETDLAAAAVSGLLPPAGPQWAVRLRPPERSTLAYDKPLCASMDGFTLHAATRAGALDTYGREALLRYVLRPPIAQPGPWRGWPRARPRRCARYPATAEY